MTKAMAQFRALVKDRGQHLRAEPFEKLLHHEYVPTENIVCDSRPATIATIVQTRSDGSLRVVVQGFMKWRWLPWKDVAIDGFYKYPDGTVVLMPKEEFYEFD